MTGRELAPAEERPTALEQYDPTKYNILSAITLVGPDTPYLRMRPVVVKLDPADDNHFYPTPGTAWSGKKGEKKPDKVSPAKGGLLEIAKAMGLEWTVDDVTPASVRRIQELAGKINIQDLQTLLADTRHDVAYRVTLAVPDGVGFRYLTASFEWDMDAQKRVIKRDADKRQKDYDWRLRQHQQGKGDKPYTFDRATYEAERLDQAIIHRKRMAESKAILAGIRMTGVRNSYRREEAARPFVVQRIEMALDPDDPEVKRLILERASRSATELYGRTPTLPAPMGGRPNFAAAHAAGEVKDLTPDAEEGPEGAAAPPADDAGSAFDDNGDESEPKAAESLPTLEEAKAECERLWGLAHQEHQAKRIEQMPPKAPKGATVEQLMEWCEQCRSFIGEKATAGAGAT